MTLSPNPSTGANGASLDDVSCVSARFCVAVGGASYPSNNGGRALVETWNGKAWAITESPLQPEPAGSVLRGVSCRSAAACVAVGNDFTATVGDATVHPRAQVWDGTHWTVAPAPDAAGAVSTSLEKVACGAARSCLAVGDFSVDPRAFGAPVAEVFDGAEWRMAPRP
jgi:hypothetical protein